MGYFHRLWLAQTVSLSGDLLAAFAVQTMIVFRLHGTPADAAGVLIAALLPSILLGPVAGVFADRWNPKTLLFASDLIRAVLVSLLAFTKAIPQIYALSFATSCATAFSTPAQNIAIPLLVERNRLVDAASRMQQSAQAVRIVSPGLAGWMVYAGGPAVCYFADAATFVISAGLVFSIPFPKGCERIVPCRTAGTRFREWTQGVQFLWSDPAARFVALAWALGTFAMGCFGALAVVYVRDDLMAGPSLLSVMGTFAAAGTIAGCRAGQTVLASVGDKRGVLIGMAAMGLALLSLATMAHLWLVYLATLSIGLGGGMMLMAATGLVFDRTPSDFRGRVSTACASLAALAQLGALVAVRLLAPHLGVKMIFILSSLLLLAPLAIDVVIRSRAGKLAAEGVIDRLSRPRL